MVLPIVSIVIPVHNRAWCVGDAVQSALQQDYPRTEVIVVDDGSTDDLRSALSRFEGRVRVLSNARAGANAARNLGLQACRGELVQFLDSDDLIDSRKIGCQSALFRDANIDLVLCDTMLWAVPDPPRLERSHLPPEGDHLLYFLANSFATSVPLFRKSALQAIGGFRPSLPKYQDLDLHLRLALKGAQAALCPLPLYTKRIHDRDSISRTWTPPALVLELFLDWISADPAATRTAERRAAWSDQLERRATALLEGGNYRICWRALLQAARLRGDADVASAKKLALLAQVVGGQICRLPQRLQRRWLGDSAG